jgi:UDP-GlcNAc:undecaprenyl-phosphate GlcNAc-1-phosphate transferase
VTFPINVYLGAIVGACLTVLVALPLWRKWCLRTGLVDDPGKRKIHDQPVPLAGGLAVMTGLVVPAVVACVLLWWRNAAGGRASEINTTSHPGGGFPLLDPNSVFLLEYGLGRRAMELAGIFAGAFGMLWVGWLDDKRELSPRAKFAGQLLIAALVAASVTPSRCCGSSPWLTPSTSWIT